MGLLQEKLAKYDLPQKFMAQGVYPYFREIEGKQGTEVEMGGHEVLMFGSNAYTGLTGDERVIEAGIKAMRKYGSGCAGSRFLNGTLDLHVQLEKELADAQNASSANADYISQLEAQSQELQQYKENEAEFEKEKQSFYEDVVFSDVAPDIEEYKKYYESIDPANAEVLYKQVVAQTAEDEQLDDYIKTYSSMKPKEAAAIFDTMTDNLKLVAQILDGMDADSRAAILGKMTSDTAAKVTEIMKPSE